MAAGGRRVLCMDRGRIRIRRGGVAAGGRRVFCAWIHGGPGEGCTHRSWEPPRTTPCASNIFVAVRHEVEERRARPPAESAESAAETRREAEPEATAAAVSRASTSSAGHPTPHSGAEFRKYLYRSDTAVTRSSKDTAVTRQCDVSPRGTIVAPPLSLFSIFSSEEASPHAPRASSPLAPETRKA